MRVQLNYFVFAELTYPRGELPADRRAHACWYFYTIAQAAKEMIGDSTEDQFGLLEEHRWMDTRYEQQARAVCQMYQLESPDDFLQFFDPYVIKQAKVLGLPTPSPVYMRPLRIALIH